MFLGNQIRNHQSGKVNLSVIRTKTILLQNNITHPIPHHLDSSHQSPDSQLYCGKVGTKSIIHTFPSWRFSLKRSSSGGGMYRWHCSWRKLWACILPSGTEPPALPVSLNVVYVGYGCPGRKHDHCQECICRTAGTPLSCTCLLLHFCSLREQFHTAFVRPGLPNDTLGKSTPSYPSPPVTHPYF